MDPRLSLADPGNSASLVVAATWVEALVTGTTATIVATIAVGSVGFLMLQGRLPLRRGLVVVIGCFVIFGSSTLVEGLMAVGQSASTFASSDTISPPAPATPPAAPPQPSVYDPYAGASVPNQ